MSKLIAIQISYTHPIPAASSEGGEQALERREQVFELTQEIDQRRVGEHGGIDEFKTHLAGYIRAKLDGPLKGMPISKAFLIAKIRDFLLEMCPKTDFQDYQVWAREQRLEPITDEAEFQKENDEKISPLKRFQHTRRWNMEVNDSVAPRRDRGYVFIVKKFHQDGSFDLIKASDKKLFRERLDPNHFIKLEKEEVTSKPRRGQNVSFGGKKK